MGQRSHVSIGNTHLPIFTGNDNFKLVKGISTFQNLAKYWYRQ